MLELLRDLLRKAFEKISRLRITGTTVQPGGLVLSKAVLEGLLSKSQEWESMISKRLVIIALSKLLNDSSAVDQWQRPLTRLLDPIAATPPVDIEQINADELIFEKLPCSEIMYARGTTRYLIDKLPFNPPSKSRTNEKFKVFQSGAFDTVRMLQHADPRLMSILNCSGVRKTDGQELDIQLMYPIPDNLLQPRSLRDLLTSNDGSDRDGEIHALDDRYQMANQIATAVLYVHSGNFVHKRIKPENIVVFSTDTDRFPHSLGYSIVTGFNRTRTTETSSFMIGDIKLEDCLYQHPNRWGVVAESKYKMLHDVYSLGVVLLEIGLWKPFVRWRSDGPGICWSSLEDFVDSDGTLKKGKFPGDVRAWLIEVAERLLPRKMGRSYKDVVIACLSGSFESGPGEDEKSELGFIKNVVSKLERLQRKA